MKPLARKTAASTLAVALVMGSVPSSVFAQTAAAAPAPAPKVDPGAALQQLRQWGVFKGDDDVLKTYLGDADHLTPLGSALYLSLIKTHDPKLEKAAILDEVAGLKPAFDRLRGNGPYDETREQSVDRTLQLFEKKFGKIDAASSGSVEDEYRRGALREALMTGASVATPAKQSDMVQVKVKDGYEFWDKNGLAYRINDGEGDGKNAATTYNRELQKAQRAMNQNRPPEVKFIPETGRYNAEIFDYSYWRLKDQYDALVEGMRRDRVIALAEMLGVSGKYREDMWFTDKRIQADLEAEAKAKFYNHQGKDYNLLKLVDDKFEQRRIYLEGAAKGVERFMKDRDALKAGLKANPVVSDAQVQNLSLDEQYTLRFLSLGVLETQSFYVSNQISRLDPSSPDAAQVMKAIDASDMTQEQKDRYKVRAREMVAKLKALGDVLEKTRATLSAADYAASLDMANAALASSQRELGLLGSDYSMYVEIPSVAFLAMEQADVSWKNFGAKLTRGIYKTVAPGTDYAAAMKAIVANQGKLKDIAVMIADGHDAEARQAVIAMNPGAMKQSFSAALGGDPARITDATRLAASLKANRDRIGTVFETNKWLDAGGTFITWTVGMAVAAPAMRIGANGVGQWLGRFTGEAAAGQVSALSNYWIVRRPAIVAREILLHTATRLGQLSPDKVWVQSKAHNIVTQTMLATTMRAGSVAARQAAFTGMSAGISGAFTVGQHLWDEGSQVVFSSGTSATVQFNVPGDIPVISGHYDLGIRPSDSMYSDVMEAFWTGAKGGSWWANTMMNVGGVPLLHPGMLGYIGLPSTAFRDTSLMRYAELVGGRGVVGSGYTGVKWLVGSGAAAAGEGAAQRGFLENLAMKGAAGKISAFTLGMADNVAKYAVFSDVVGWAGKEYAYHVPSATIPDFVPWVGGNNVGGYHDEESLERRIKGANAAGASWLASPAWMLIPTYAAHAARDAALYQRGAQGAQQYRAAGRDYEIANAEEGARLPFVKTPAVPLTQLIFETSLKSPDIGDQFIVTKELRRDAIKHQILTSLGGEKATPAGINPLEFYRATKLEDGDQFVDLSVNNEVRLVAHQDFVESLLADVKRSERVLDAVPGSTVEGFGRVTPDIRRDVAVALFSSEMQTGKTMPQELAGRVDAILKPYLDANSSMKPNAEGMIKALDAAPVKSEAFGVPDAKEPGWALKDVMAKVEEWKATKNPDDHPYTEVLSELRASADREKAGGRLNENEHALLTKLYDYLEALESRFNAFNNVPKARGLAMESIDALKTHYRDPKSNVNKMLGHFSSELDKWADAQSMRNSSDPLCGGGPCVAGPRSDGSFKKMVKSLSADLETAKSGMTAEEFADMKATLSEIGASPWVLHDSKGGALANWKPEQFVSLMGTMTAIIQQGRGGAPVRLFQMLKTGGGKTMLTFEGLLPLVEADAANRDMQPMFLTVQSNLEAQARMEFIAYKKIGSNLKFDTYEGFKTKIAEGKTKGKNTLDEYWILGDEMDGAALQPALTIGQVTGAVARRAPIYNKIDELDTGLVNRLTREQSSRDSRVRTEARRAQNALARLTSSDADAMKTEGKRLDNAAGRLKDARGPEARRAASADLREGIGRLEKLLDGVPSRDADAVSMTRQSLGRLKENLSKPSSDPSFRSDAVKELEAGFTREENLLGLKDHEQGLTRLSIEAGARGAELEGRIGQLTSDIEAARPSKAPGAAERLGSLRDELSIAQKELAIVDRFRSADAGQRLANLQEKLAAARGEPGSAPAESVATWKSQAAEYGKSLPAELQPAAKAHADALGRLYEIGGEMRALDVKIADAAREGRSVGDLATRRAALDGDYATVRAEAARLKAQLSAGSATGELGGMMRRLDTLKNQTSSEARAERRAILKGAQEEVRRRLSASADDVVAVARDGQPGWENASVRLIERRRQMMEAFAGDENAMYSEFRDMRDDMQAFAMNEQLKSSDPAVYKPARDRLMKLVEGEGAIQFLPKVPKLLWEVFTGRDVDIPVDQMGLTRLHAAKMLKALFDDPTLPAHQRDNMFWSLTSSLLRPGNTRGATEFEAAAEAARSEAGKLAAQLASGASPLDVASTKRRVEELNAEAKKLDARVSKARAGSSWVRTELLRQLHGFVEDPAGIRMDSRSGRINVVHNGQWFESMDNETRRFWELEYGVDLTLPYTNSSISTIKDVTTNKKARFISFSGTAGEKLREHFEDNGIRIEGEGSRAPVDPDRVILPALDSASQDVLEAIKARLGRALSEGDVVRLSDFGDASHAAARQWLEGLPRASSVEMDVVSGPTDRISRVGEALADVIASRGEVLVRSLDGASPAVRAAVERKIGGKLTGARVLTLSEFEGPGLAEAHDWLTGLRERSGDADHVVLRSGDAVPLEAKPAIDAYLAGAKLAGKDDAVVRISDVKGATDAQTAAAQKWLRELRSNQGDTGLIVLSVSDTRVLKMVREYLTRVKGIREDEIAMVFSDTEYLRNNVPAAKVGEQMNLGALKAGRARVLILDTRVGGRGLDLEFKGERDSTDPKAFRGYTNFEMLIVDPQKMSQVHLLQAQGRIDVGRVLPGASRGFSLVMDVRTVQGERVFRDMVAQDPFFAALRSDPKFIAFETKRGGKADWAMFHDYVFERAIDGSADGRLLAEQYQDVVKEHLEIQQGEIEENQLRSSSVLTDAPKKGGRYPGIEGMR